MRRVAVRWAFLVAIWAAVSGSARAADDAMSLYLQGLQYASDGETDNAIKDLSAAAALDTTAAEIPRELARVLIDARRLDEALPVAVRAQRMAPNDPEANGLLGQVRMLRQEPKEAVESLERARHLDLHALDGLLAVVRQDDDAREDDLREERHRQPECGVHSAQDEDADAEEEGALVPVRERDQAHPRVSGFLTGRMRVESGSP